MSERNRFSRRDWLKGAAAISGAALGTRLGGKGWLGEASAQQVKKAAVVSIFLEGGFNAIFSSADSFFSNRGFGVSNNPLSVRDIGNGLFVDAGTIGSLDDWSRGHMAAIGNRHGAIDHANAPKANYLGDGRSFPLQLAVAIGGSAAYKAVALGSLPTAGVTPSESGTSLQLLRTMGDVSTALGLGRIDYNRPARKTAARAIDGSRVMSEAAMARNQATMSSARDAYTTLVDSLKKPVLAIDVDGVAQAYGTSTGSGLDTVKAKMAAAELMIRSGTNVITLSDTGWDTHGDPQGATARGKMRDDIIPSLRVFLGRLQSEPELAAMNVSVIIHGDFARDLPSSDHAPALSALVIGSNVKVGTTGRVSDRVQLPDGTPGSRGMWSYLAALSKVTKNPFGDNPHQLVL